VVFERGRFTAADTAAVASILRVLALAVPAWVAQQIAVRAFFARGDTWRPMLLGTALAVLALPLYLALRPRYGVEGLAAAGALGVAANALATLLLARRLHGAPRLVPLAASALRSALAAGVGVAAALAAARAPLARAALVELAIGGAAFALAGGAAILVFGDVATRRALVRLGARLRRLAR